MTLQEFLALQYYGNGVAAWLVAAAILVGGWGVLAMVRRVAIRRLERFADRTSTPVDDLALRGLRHTSTAFLFVLALLAATEFALVLRPNVATAVRVLATLAFLLQGARWGNGAITFWLERVAKQRVATDRASLTTIAALAALARVLLWTLIVLLALGTFGIDVTALVTGLGIAGVAVALAVQNVLGDILASLSIVLDKPFVIGDAIAFETFSGTVEDIGLKTTRLRSTSGEQLIVSNAELLKARIRNYQRQGERRIQFTVGVSYDTPPDRVARAPQIIREALTRHEHVRFDRSHFQGFLESSLNVETVYFVVTPDYAVYMDVQQRVNLEILERFRAEGIEFAFPARPVVVVSEPGAIDAARPAASPSSPAPSPAAPSPAAP